MESFTNKFCGILILNELSLCIIIYIIVTLDTLVEDITNGP